MNLIVLDLIKPRMVTSEMDSLSEQMKCLTSYMKTLSNNEMCINGTESSGKAQPREERQTPSFTDRITSNKERVERCSDDFSYFNFHRQTTEDFLPPVELVYSEKCGRFLQASRDIEAGETLFWEPPMVLAPKGGSKPVCLDCFCPFPTKEWPTCPRCKAPKCNEGCEGSDHSHAECDLLRDAFGCGAILSDVQFIKKLNTCLTPLRSYLGILECPSIADVIAALQSHTEERKNSSIAKFIDELVVPFIREKFPKEISTDFIHHICGVFDTNAFDVTIGDSKRQARALLPLAAMMNHSCTPNTQHWFFAGFCVVRSSVAIRKGESITATYTQTLWGNKMRQTHLALTKLFSCSCARCLDPSEFGTHLSSIRCQKCNTEDGYITPPRFIVRVWSCQSCGEKLPESSAMSMVKVASSFASSTEDMDIEDLKKILFKIRTMPGRQHYTSIQLHLLYIKRVIGNIEKENIENLLSEVLPSIEFLLSVAEKIEPGLTRLKGLLLLYKLRTIIHLLSRDSIGAAHNNIIKNMMNNKFTQELDRDVEMIENILKWDVAMEDVKVVRREWNTAKEKNTHWVEITGNE